MITADNGQRGFPGPRGIMLQAPNAGSLIDFSGDVLRTPGVMAGMSNWSNDGQPPSALESTQLAGEAFFRSQSNCSSRSNERAGHASMTGVTRGDRIAQA